MNDFRQLDAVTEYEQAYAEEDLLLRVTEQIADALLDRGLRQVDLADALGLSEARVSQMMSGTKNLTLKTLARIGLVLGGTVAFEFQRPVRVEEYRWAPPEPIRALGDDAALDLAA